jgi:hypothetical protein
MKDLTKFKYKNLEFIRNLVTRYENVETSGLTIEYCLSEDVFKKIDEDLFYTLNNDDNIKFEESETINLNIKGVKFRFIKNKIE